MLTTRDLTAMRDTQYEALPETATIRRTTETSDGMGGRQPATSDVGVTPCRLAPLGQSAQERVIAERLTGMTAYVATLPAGTDVRMEDEISIGARVLRVIAVLGRSYETARRVVCVEMT